MATKSTAVKRIQLGMSAVCVDGPLTKTLEIHWVDPGNPRVYRVDRFIVLPSLEMISITLTI